MATYPAFTVEFAPGIDASAVPAGGDWVDLTDRVPEWATSWGRADEFSEAGAGTASLVIRNDDGEFDPDNTGGTYYGDLEAGTWFRIKAGTTTANTDVFYGHVDDDGFQVSPSQFADQWVTITLVDDLEQLAHTDAPESVWAQTVDAMNPLSWWRLGESSGTVMVDSSGNRHHGEYLNGETFNSRTGLVDGSGDSAIFFDEGAGLTSAIEGGGLVSLIEHPTAALTAFPLSVAFWFSGDATPASPVSAGKVVWWQEPSGGDGAGTSIYIQHSGSAGTAVGAVDDGFLVSISDGTGNFRRWHTPGSLFDGAEHLVTITVTDPSAVTGSYDGDSISMTNYSSGGSVPAIVPGAVEQRVGVGLNNTITLDEVIVFDSVIDTTEAANLYAAGHEPWAGELTSARVTHILDAVGFPASLRNIDTGNSTMQAAALDGTDAATLIRAAATAEAGFVYIDHQDGGKLRFIDRRERWTATASLTSQATFGDSGVEITYDAVELRDDRRITDATMQRSNGAAITVSDATASAARRRTYSQSGLEYETDAESRSRAERIVAEKAARQRVPKTITLRPRDSDHSAWAHVFARKVDDRITVKWRPPYGGTYSFAAWIDGITHRYRAGEGLETSFLLSPVPYGGTGTPYWLLGTSTLGTDTRPGY